MYMDFYKIIHIGHIWNMKCWEINSALQATRN